jgi:hypothetical protein
MKPADTITHLFCVIVLQVSIVSLLTTTTTYTAHGSFQIDPIPHLPALRIHNHHYRYYHHRHHHHQPQHRIIDTTTTASSTRRYHGPISNIPNDKTSSSSNYKNAKNESGKLHFQSSHRRNVLRQMVTVVSFMVADRPSANAFANKISNQYDDRPKRRGPLVRFSLAFSNNNNNYNCNSNAILSFLSSCIRT